jgi:hypothetical protein
VVVSGTTGNVSTKGIRFTQRGWLWQLKGFSLGAGYQYLRHQARFQFGNSFEIHTQPPLAILEKLPIQETTRSRTHEFDVAASRLVPPPPGIILCGRTLLPCRLGISDYHPSGQVSRRGN